MSNIRHTFVTTLEHKMDKLTTPANYIKFKYKKLVN